MQQIPYFWFTKCHILNIYPLPAHAMCHKTCQMMQAGIFCTYHFLCNKAASVGISQKKYRDFVTKTDKNRYICKNKQANITQLVERNLPKVEVAGSSPVVRSSSLF